MRTIPLTRGYVAIVDDEDYTFLMGFKWKSTQGKYAVRYNWCNELNRTRATWMHKVVMSCPSGIEVDHINGDTLDNRKSNLRFATRILNMLNIKRRRPTKYNLPQGVRRCCRRYVAEISRHNLRYYLGRYDTPQEAKRVYQSAKSLAVKQEEAIAIRLHYLLGRTHEAHA